ncbi:F-box/FBD/LRR-repeat protein At3g14710-like [Chenopodium quinoa]|uniref:F-box/FBD/LRR-repeat protein At3g14710-like n=1 Tax=Chenopodium quinoa TaxID=63459 RepID=UPI000B78E2A5|nr:F-box/FBD/LRR-repeat protein At3g14710-like [Chenopodium quinoa]
MRPYKEKMLTSNKRKLSKKRKLNNDDYSGEVDRLSSLPDSLLITILSLVDPINSAAATSVLSHRWRHLWTQITHVSLGPWTSWKYIHNLRDFNNVVNHILFQLTSSKLYTFCLHLPSLDNLNNKDQEFDEFNSGVRDCIVSVAPWIQLVSRRNPEVITVTFNDSYSFRFLEMPPVPASLLQTQSLVTLDLIAHIELTFPKDDLRVNLPNLKKLCMNLYDSQRRVMDTLFRSCPLLEHLLLYLHLKQPDHLIHISAPNLKDLKINMEESPLLSIHTKFVVNTPKLEHFKVKGLLAVYDFVTNPTYLRLVKMTLQRRNAIDRDFVNARQGLFRGICCVRNIKLVDYYRSTIIRLLDFVAGLNGLPSYHNLVYLRFHCSESDYDFNVIHNNWRPQFPSCWSANLKRIDVSVKIRNNRVEMNLLSNILSSATALEQLLVSPPKVKPSARPNQLWNEYTFCRELFMRPRSSPTSKIHFTGKMMTASCNDFSYDKDELTCKILKQNIRPYNR